MSEPTRHVLAQVRQQTELTQAQLAKLLGVALITVQRIEQGSLALSEELALRIQSELDVSASYLLANDPSTPMVAATGAKWRKRHFELVQGSRYAAKAEKPIGVQVYGSVARAADEFTHWRLLDITAKVHALLAGSAGLPRSGILLHRLYMSLASLENDFPTDKATLESYAPRLAKLRAAFEARSEAIADAESEALWGDKPNQARPSSGDSTSK
jgi:transcriptional regulator with XRE-family HTH domain